MFKGGNVKSLRGKQEILKKQEVFKKTYNMFKGGNGKCSKREKRKY